MTALTFVTTGLGTGGAETMLYRLICALPQRFRCSVVSLMDAATYGDALERRGVPVHCVGMKRGRPSFAALREVRRRLRSPSPDLVQGWMYHGNLAASLARMTGATRAPVLWNVRHALDDLAGERALTRSIIHLGAPMSRGVARVVYVSTRSREQHERLGYDHARGVVLPNGYDLDEFRPDAAVRDAVRRELGIGAKDVVVGQVARWHPIKGHAMLIEAAERVVREHPEATFVLAGLGCDADNQALRGLLERSGVAANFRLLGECRDVARLMNAFDLIVQPSLSEGFPNVICEAAASAVPCVATRVGGTPEAAGPGALLVPPGRADLLAAELLSALSWTPEERRQRGERARAHVLERHSIDGAAAAYAALYEEVLAGARR